MIRVYIKMLAIILEWQNQPFQDNTKYILKEYITNCTITCYIDPLSKFKTWNYACYGIWWTDFTCKLFFLQTDHSKQTGYRKRLTATKETYLINHHDTDNDKISLSLELLTIIVIELLSYYYYTTIIGIIILYHYYIISYRFTYNYYFLNA